MNGFFGIPNIKIKRIQCEEKDEIRWNWKELMPWLMPIFQGSRVAPLCRVEWSSSDSCRVVIPEGKSPVVLTAVFMMFDHFWSMVAYAANCSLHVRLTKREIPIQKRRICSETFISDFEVPRCVFRFNPRLSPYEHLSTRSCRSMGQPADHPAGDAAPQKSHPMEA